MTRSARGEFFNPLVYPFLLTTFAYGLGLTAFSWTAAVQKSSLVTALDTVAPFATVVWGAVALAVIIVGLYVLIFDKPPVGKANCFVAWLLWAFAAMAYILTGNWLTVFSVAIPSLMFWTWQYFELSRFRHEDVLDRATMGRYDRGQYDHDAASGRRRRNNRGVSENDRTPD